MEEKNNNDMIIESIKKMIKDGHLDKNIAEEYIPELKSEEENNKVPVTKELYEHIRNAFECLEDADCSDEELPRKWKEERYDQAREDLDEVLKLIYVCDDKTEPNHFRDFLWKPTERQMKVIKRCSRILLRPEEREALETLIDDLNKLLKNEKE